MKSVFAEHRHHARRVSRLGRLRGGVGVALALEFLVAYGCTHVRWSIVAQGI